MSNKIIEIPFGQPIRFKDDQHPYKDTPQTVGNEKSFAESLDIWNIQKGYCQKWTTWDYIGVQIQIGGEYVYNGVNAKLRILDKNKKQIGLVSPAFTNQLYGNTHRVDNIDYGLTTVNFRFNPVNYGVRKNDIYYFQLQVGYVSDNDWLYDYFTSEPQYIADYHPRTVIMEYISFENKLDIDYTNMFFHFRVEAVLTEAGFSNETIGFEDQNLRLRQQLVKPKRNFVLNLGQYTSGLPAWVHDTVNRIMANDLILIQKTRFIKELDEELTVQGDIGRYKLFKSSIVLREFDYTEAFRSVTKIPILAFERPATGYPYLVREVTLVNTTTQNRVVAFAGFEIQDAYQEQLFISVLNSYRGGGTLGGYFAMDGDKCRYYNGVNESFNGNDSYIWYKFWDVEMQKAFINGTSAIHMDISVEGMMFSMRPLGHTEVYNYGSPASSYTWYHLAFDFANRGNPNSATVRFWHDDTVSGIQFINRSVKDWDMPFAPSGLRQVYIRDTDIQVISTYTWNSANIELFVCINGELTDVLGMDIKAWTSLLLFGVGDNKLTTAVRDRIINDINTVNYPLRPNGYIDMATQTPPVGAVGANTAASRNKFTAANWGQNY